MFSFLVLSGRENDFYNIVIDYYHATDNKNSNEADTKVYCTSCGGLIGFFKNDVVTIQQQRLIRVDPLHLITVCVEDAQNSARGTASHQHITHMMMIENGLASPIIPISLQSIRGGQVLPVPCPESLNNFPREPEVYFPNALQLNTTPNENSTTTNIAGSIAPILIDSDLEALNDDENNNQITAPVVAIEPSEQEIALCGAVAAIEPEVVVHTDREIASTIQRTRPKKKKVILKLRSILKKKHAKQNRVKKSVSISLPTEQTTISDASTFIPVPSETFTSFLDQQPSSSSNIYDPSTTQMLVRQRAHELASNVVIPEHDYVSFYFNL